MLQAAMRERRRELRKEEKALGDWLQVRAPRAAPPAIGQFPVDPLTDRNVAKRLPAFSLLLSEVRRLAFSTRPFEYDAPCKLHRMAI
jgi:hypothetical protein